MSNFSKNIFIFLLSQLVCSTIFAQHQLGMRLEKNAGINSIAINPANILSSNAKWEFHLIGGGLFFENDYFFLRNTSANRLIRQRSDIQLVFDQRSDAPNIFEIDFGRGNQNRFLSTNGYLAGPAVAYKLQEDKSIAIFSQIRSIAGSNKIPGDYSYYHITNRPFN
ncbi:MAG TPA: hypothetical protein PKD85_05740, partial [Saprospiraceae bacterium]|nr:hypothetical protein [Saprospiraceae bacterium]